MYKIIPNTNENYSCDELGNIKSNKRKVWNGKAYYEIEDKVLKPWVNNKGYAVVSLRINNQTVDMLVHRLVASTWLDNPNNYPIVNHKDNNPLNNSVDNLEWCTYSYNTLYAEKQGRRPLTELQKEARSEKSTWLYTPVIQYDKNNNYIAEYNSITEAQNKTGINKSNISACCKNKTKTAGGYIWKYKQN